MLSIMRINGRVVCATKSARTPLEKPIVLMRDKFNNPIIPIRYPSPDCKNAIWDHDLGISYNVHNKLLPADGWATALFWVNRWHITHDELLIFVQNYAMDAGIEKATGYKKYKCKDERALKESALWKQVFSQKKKREKTALNHLRFGANKWR